jgi:hypothetical protein
MKFGANLLEPDPKLLGVAGNLRVTFVKWEKVDLAPVEGGTDIDELRIDVDEDVGFAQFGSLPEECRGSRDVPSGLVHPLF